MKKICVILCLLLLSANIGCFAKTETQFSLQEKESLALINQIKEFEKTLNFQKTENFKEFDEEVDYAFLSYHEKTKMPFSYIDPDTKEIDMPVNAEIDIFFLQSKGIDPLKYDFFLYRAEAIANGCKITKRLLNSSPKRLIYVVIHEDWHNNADLPTHIEEASGELIGYVGMWKFLNKDSDEIRGLIETTLKQYIIINECYEKLNSLSLSYSLKKINELILETEKEKMVSDCKRQLSKINPDYAHWQKFNAATISLLHTYSYYFPLMHRLFYALDADLNKTIGVLKNMPIHGPNWYFSEKNYFEKTREAEKQIESYLENIIQNSKKNEPIIH